MEIGKLSLRDLQTALDCAEKANRIARANYGLDAQNNAAPRVTVNVGVIDKRGLQADGSYPPAIDVPSTLLAEHASEEGLAEPAPSSANT